MSSNLHTHFVVYYDHTDGKFYLDDETASQRFEHDTWDEDNEEWGYLDSNNDVPETVSELSDKLANIIRKAD
jgi:hypothetical protein